MIRSLYTLLFLLMSFFSCYAQQQLPIRNSGVDLPWLGGLNSCQFGEIDLNRDGVLDLLVFDRMGNRLIPLLRQKIDGKVQYTYDAEIIGRFPKIESWLQLKDYNQDGLVDIFTYSPSWAGMKVYKNTSEEQLSFKAVAYPYLKSTQGGGEINILVTYADYPGIIDLDSDGDLDILTFWGLGSFVEFHQNLSIEKYGHADSLIFQRNHSCWGFFAENDESNKVYLDSCWKKRPIIPKLGPDLRHTGSTFFLHDFTQNGLFDLVLGDVDYPELILLENGGSNIDAFMLKQTNLFPNDKEPISLFSMPACFEIDVDMDGLKDLLVSPFDPSPIVSQNKKSIWYYHNDGELNHPIYNLVQKDFLQNRMLDFGTDAYPILFDWNRDGLKDLFVGNWGEYKESYYENGFLKSRYASSISYFQNVGQAGQAEFKLIDSDFGNLKRFGQKGLFPAFFDFNQDNLQDLIVGAADGNIKVLLQKDNNQWAEELQDFIQLPGSLNTAPVFYDLDQDGDLDLFVGESQGKIYAFEQDQNKFNQVSDFFGQINVTDTEITYRGNSKPCFFYDKNIERTAIMIGSSTGDIYAFWVDSENWKSKFTAIDLEEISPKLKNTVQFGNNLSACLGSLDKESDPVLIIGNQSGGLNWLNSGLSPKVIASLNEEVQQEDLFVFPNPIKHGELNLRRDDLKESSIRIYDMQGRLIYTQEWLNKYKKIDLSAYRSGVYLVLVSGKSGGVNRSRKVILY